MKSRLFPEFGIPDRDCKVEADLDPIGVARLFFRSPDSPEVALNLATSVHLQQRSAAIGETEVSIELLAIIQIARDL